MSKLTYYSKAVWFPLILILAVIGLDASPAAAQEIQWRHDLAAAKAEARDTNRLVWLHFTADWCVPCKRLESFVFSSTGVIRAADQNTVAVKIDADDQESLVKQLEVPRIPYDVVMTPSGRVILNRFSPKDSAGFLKMFNGLDRPLQELSSSDREVVNARIDKLHGVIKRSGGLSQKESDLDLDSPSHQMASTTVEGQRLERGFESSVRAAEVRTRKAQSLKQNAERYIALEEKRQKSGQLPMFSENPFFKSAESSAKTELPTNKPLFGNQPQTPAVGSPKTISNAFVKQDRVVQLPADKIDPDFVPPLPPTFGKKAAEKIAVKTEVDLKAYEDRKEFSFGATAPAQSSATTQEIEAKTALSLKAPKLTLPKFAEQKQALPKHPAAQNSSLKELGSDKFAYAPVNELRKSLSSASKPNVFQAKPTPKQSMVATAPVRVQPRPAVETHAEIKRTGMKTDVSIPQAPVMVEGVVQIAETFVPAVEGRLVAAEQTLDERSLVGAEQPQDTIKKQISRTDRLLENVNFFAEDTQPVYSAPQTFAVPGQPVPQPQIVINLNTGNTAPPQPTVAANQAVIVQPNLAVPSNPATEVAQASSTAAVANRAKISSADIASAVRSKFALKGKCPVTLLSQGQWVDGKKEIGCVHRDRVYLFATAAHREAFLADPDRLSPLLAGFDPVIFEETGKLFEGDEKFGTFMGKKPNQRIVLFKTADTRERFQKEPSKYLDVVRKAMTDNAPQDIKLR